MSGALRLQSLENGFSPVSSASLQAATRRLRPALCSYLTFIFVASPDRYRTFVNRGWVQYTGITVEQASGSGWEAAVHPDDLKRVTDRWQTSAAKGEALEYEARQALTLRGSTRSSTLFLH
jgi:PAS domain-containing protein